MAERRAVAARSPGPRADRTASPQLFSQRLLRQTCGGSVLSVLPKHNTSPLGFVVSGYRSQLPVSKWHEQIGDPTLADGILDRLVHNAHRIEMRGDSMRKNRGKPTS